MVRTEISLFMKNVPGELGKLASLFGSEGVNIDALTIQDASSYVQELFRARGKSLKRIASAASYNSMRKDSVEFALIRLLVGDTDKAVDLLSQNDYIFELMPVIALELLGGIALIVGFQTRLVAALLAIFSVSSALITSTSSPTPATVTTESSRGTTS